MHIKTLDAKDNEIINLLLTDARMSYSDLGEKVGLSRTAVKNRIAAMEKSGILKGYRAIVDPQETPETTTFLLNIETKAENFDQARETLAKAPEVITLVQTTGRCHMTGFCIAPDKNTMREFINHIYRSVPGITAVSAHSVLEFIKGSVHPEV